MTTTGSSKLSLRRMKDCVMLTLFVFADRKDLETGEAVDARPNSLPYVGHIPSRRHLTGVYGTNSRETALFLAAGWAEQRGLSPYLLDVWARVANPSDYAIRTRQTTRETMQQTHWLHADRAGLTLKTELHQKALKWLMAKHGPVAHAQAIEKSLADVMLQYPEFAIKVLDDEKDLHMLIHPVYAEFDTKTTRTPFWAGTMRLDRIEILGAEIRYMPHVPVKVG